MFLKHILYLKEQTIFFEKLYITVPIKYSRFDVNIMNPKIFNQLKEIDYIKVIYIDKDYGPATKYLGPLLYEMNEIKNNYLIIIDDDRFYNPKMIEMYKNFFDDNQDIWVASGNQELYFNFVRYNSLPNDYLKIIETNFKFVSGFMSFCLKINDDLLKLKDYTFFILENIKDSFFHDEGILLNFFSFMNIRVFYINFKFVNLISSEMSDALSTLHNINKEQLEEEIRIYTNKTNYFGNSILVFPRNKSILRRKYLF
jgi:hypothetical protein